MISFIVIGRNEGWKITKCLNSIIATVQFNALTQYEIIYVDSCSNDDSVERAIRFPNIKIFKICGDINAAIARNVGANSSNGKFLFFIDGDMEIFPEFLNIVYKENVGLLHDFTSGNVVDYNYTYNSKLIFKEKRENSLANARAEKVEFSVGGIFLIKREIWQQYFGMKSKLRRSQDIDFAIRLAKNGVFLIRKKQNIAIHHTIPYNDIKRSWHFLWHGFECYRSVLLRDNISNIFQWKIFLRENYTSIFLFISVVSLFLPMLPMLFILGVYSILICIRSFVRRGSIFQKLNRIAYFIIRDLMTFFAFFLFWPSKCKNFIIQEIDN